MDLDAPEYLRGGVVACSSDDMHTWKWEGVMLHYANLTDWVFGQSEALRGCCASHDEADPDRRDPTNWAGFSARVT